ncbi:MAG: glycerol-3-phosphate 1-O-acyltransferase PlsY [Stagnimonas sp.]|nr:glycerol-3-phosphate 1-O-acyltransferase PlsY [Stagnimonas sp.]
MSLILTSFGLMVLAYLLGSLMGGFIVGRLRGGIDLRASGSGNVGATNALRTQGTAFALAVLLIDIGKGVVAALLLPRLIGGAATPELGYACGAAAVLGHCYPLWHRFQGGKGVATVAGVFAALLPATFLWIIAAFVLVVLLTGTVSLATLSASAVALLQVSCFSSGGLFSAAGAFTAAMALLLVVKHRANWARLRAGSEPRFEKARLLGRALGLK